MAIFFNFPPTSSHLHPLQVENCDSNSRLVVDEDDKGKFRLERAKSEPPSETLVQQVPALLHLVLAGLFTSHYYKYDTRDTWTQN